MSIIGGKVPQVETIDDGRSWYVSDGGIGWSAQYLHHDGLWHDDCGDAGRWPTREAAEAFLSQAQVTNPHVPFP